MWYVWIVATTIVSLQVAFFLDTVLAKRYFFKVVVVVSEIENSMSNFVAIAIQML